MLRLGVWPLSRRRNIREYTQRHPRGACASLGRQDRANSLPPEFWLLLGLSSNDGPFRFSAIITFVISFTAVRIFTKISAAYFFRFGEVAAISGVVFLEPGEVQTVSLC